jgi:hypothetical protein
VLTSALTWVQKSQTFTFTLFLCTNRLVFFCFRSGDAWSIDLSSRFVHRGAAYSYLFELDVIHYPITPSISVCCSNCSYSTDCALRKETRRLPRARRGAAIAPAESRILAADAVGGLRASSSDILWCVVALRCSSLYVSDPLSRCVLD